MNTLLRRPIGVTGPTRVAAVAVILLVLAIVTAGCGPGGDDDGGPPYYFETLPPGIELPGSEICAGRVLTAPSVEVRPENEEANNTTVDVSVDIDGADDVWNARLAPRIGGEFTGTTEQILRWASCKWGFDEDITRARAVTESSWLMSTAGDVTDQPDECDLLGLEAPCSQSYGLLQVKGTVHDGTYPFSARSSAFGADYAMAWLRACYEGSFDWLADAGYAAGDEWGCVGAWFSGEWLDEGARTYIAETKENLESKAWLEYAPSADRARS